jgi:hypothetical protein
MKSHAQPKSTSTKASCRRAWVKSKGRRHLRGAGDAQRGLLNTARFCGNVFDADVKHFGSGDGHPCSLTVGLVSGH